MSSLIVFGGSGVIGRGALEAASAAVPLTDALQRRPVAPPLTGVRFRRVDDFGDLVAHRDTFAEAEAIIFALGISQNAVSEPEYRRITLDYPLEAARRLVEASPRAAFVFVSGHGADPSGRSRILFGRVKGEAENRLAALGLARLVVARPAAVVPDRWPRPPSLIERLVMPLARRAGPFLPAYVIASTILGRALVKAARDPGIGGILDNAALRRLGEDPASP